MLRVWLQLPDELRNCMTDYLRHLDFAEGGDHRPHHTCRNEQRIKSLAVALLHPSVHIVNLHTLDKTSHMRMSTNWLPDHEGERSYHQGPELPGEVVHCQGFR